jgi:hypothetical protein
LRHEKFKTSALLLELRQAFADDHPIFLAEVVKKLENRAFGLLLFALAAPNCVPNIPGISTVFGVLLLAPALQLIFGAKQVWLPKQIFNIEIQPSTLRAGIDKFVPLLVKMEKMFKPRLEFLTTRPFTIVLGIQVLILALILILPLPLANMVPGMSVAILAVGIMQRDGFLVLLSMLFFWFSLLLAPMGFGMMYAAGYWLWQYLLGIFAHFQG